MVADDSPRRLPISFCDSGCSAVMCFPPSIAYCLPFGKAFALAWQRGSNYPHCKEPGRTRAAPDFLPGMGRISIGATSGGHPPPTTKKTKKTKIPACHYSAAESGHEPTPTTKKTRMTKITCGLSTTEPPSQTTAGEQWL